MNSSRKTQGFSLIELLLAVAIIAMLAGMAIPSLGNTVAEAEVSTLRQELQRVRTAVDYYAFQHAEQLPGWNGSQWSEAAFLSQLLLGTNEDGNWARVGTPGFPYGPFLTEAMPSNRFNHMSTVLVVSQSATFAGPTDQTGWVFFTDTGLFKANSSATAPDGTPVYEL